MATKYYCDICNKEVKKQESLSQLHLGVAETEKSSEFYYFHKVLDKDICITCKRDIMDYIQMKTVK